jgi:hypothetical protein
MGRPREPLDDAGRGRRQVITPPVTATLGTAEIDEAASQNQFADGKS